MMMLSFKTRGVGVPQKKLSLKRHITSLKPNVKLIQETICSGEKAKEIFSSWLENWSFCTIHVEWILGGILTGWSPDFKSLSSSSFPSSLSVNSRFKYSDNVFSVINIYGPYDDRVSYWEDLKMKVFSVAPCRIPTLVFSRFEVIFLSLRRYCHCGISSNSLYTSCCRCNFYIFLQ
jgi:hypothetical protein